MSFKENITNLLLRLPNAKVVSAGKELVCKCQFCNLDRSAHFYIKLPTTGSNIMVFNCFKCHISGILTVDKLISWNLTDRPDVLTELAKYNKENMNKPENLRYAKDMEIYRLNNTFISNTKLSEVKLKYINNRLGTEFNYQDLLNLKITLNIYDLFQSNIINTYSRSNYILDQLNKYFLGFISYDNAFLNMRSLVREEILHQSIQRRWINYNIFNKFENTLRYYCIPTEINLYNPKRITLYIAEGAFDILSIYNSVDDKTNCIFCAILGSGYSQVIKFFIISLKLMYLDIHIYPDADIDDSILFNIKMDLIPYGVDITIHRNIMDGQKDFGVKQELIKEYIYKI